MARAAAHLGAGRYAEAEGAYNAVLSLDAQEHRAHLGLADCACARGRSDEAVERLTEHARAYAEAGVMRSAFALITKALAIAPERLDLHIDVAELEAADGRASMAATRLENLARTYRAAGQLEEAELVLEAAEAFRAPAAASPPMPAAPPFVDPHTGHATPPPRAVATPPPPPPASRSNAMPVPIEPTPTPISAMVRPSPLLAAAPPPPPKATPRRAPPKAPPKAAKAPAKAPKAKRASRGQSSGAAPKWRPSTVTKDPPPPPRERLDLKPPPKPKAKKAAPRKAKLSITPAPRPRKTAQPIATVAKKRATIAPAPSPKRGGKTLDKLPPLRQKPSLATRLRAASKRRPVGEEDRTTMWCPNPTPT